ncbi:hypothetical protein ACOSQ4_019254 [Xanthoceras sorbifolium]
MIWSSTHANPVVLSPADIQTSAAVERWFPPPLGIYKINSDAAINSVDFCIGLGFVVRDAEGFVLAAGAQPLQFCVSPLVAEAMAILRGIQFASEMGISPIMVESDSLSVINIITSHAFPLSDVGVVISDIYRSIEALNDFKIIFASRQANSVAHGLAKLALSLSDASFWLEDYPPCIENLVLGNYPV